MSAHVATWTACAVAVLLWLPGCRKEDALVLTETNDGRYHVGEKWRFRARPGEENATLTIVKVESNAKLGVIVHVSVEGVRIKSAQSPSGFSETVSHMPFAEAAIEKSVTELVAKAVPLPKFEDGYRQWRGAFDSHKGGIFTITVGEAIAFMDKAISH
jgi:hypothetical protein